MIIPINGASSFITLFTLPCLEPFLLIAMVAQQRNCGSLEFRQAVKTCNLHNIAVDLEQKNNNIKLGRLL
jgi:hypothetical protein